jgi:hypothetical protein
VVASATPLRATVVELVKPDPESVSVVSVAPADTVAGLTPFTVGVETALLSLGELLLLHPKREHAQIVMTAQKNLRAWGINFGSKGYQFFLCQKTSSDFCLVGPYFITQGPAIAFFA